MALTDSIGDFLTRIRNAQFAMHRRTKVFFSRVNLSILEILKREGYIINYHKEIIDNKGFFVVQLKYCNRSPVISEIVRISKPGCRCYSGYKNIPKSYNGLGIFIISTSKGLVTDYDAHKLKVGGEILCRVF